MWIALITSRFHLIWARVRHFQRAIWYSFEGINIELYLKSRWKAYLKLLKRQETNKQHLKLKRQLYSTNYNDILIRSAPGIGGSRGPRSSNRSSDSRQTKGMKALWLKLMHIHYLFYLLSKQSGASFPVVPIYFLPLSPKKSATSDRYKQ